MDSEGESESSNRHVQKKKSKKRKREESDCETKPKAPAVQFTTPGKTESDQQKMIPQGSSYELIKKLKTTIKPDTAKKKYDKGLAEVDWEEVVIGEYTADECREWVARILRKIRKFRSLEEILEDASCQLKSKNVMGFIATPETHKKYRSEYDKKPPKGTTASRLYVNKMVAKAIGKNPNLSKLDLKKKYVAKWHNKLSDEKKIRYIQEAVEAKRKYEEALKLYVEVHPDYKHNTPPFLSKADQKLLDESQGVPEPPPRSGYLYFFNTLSREMDSNPEHGKHSLSERSKIIAKEWKEVSAEKRAEYIRIAEKKNAEYKRKLEEYLSTLTPEERAHFEAEHMKTSRRPSKQGTDVQVPNFVTAVELYQVSKRSKFESKYPDKSAEDLMCLMQESFDALSDKKKSKYKEQEKKLRDITSIKTGSPVKKSTQTSQPASKSKKSVPTKETDKKEKKIQEKTDRKTVQEESSSESDETGKAETKTKKKKQNGEITKFTAIKSNTQKKSKKSSSSSSEDSSSSSEEETLQKKKLAPTTVPGVGKLNIRVSFSSSSEDNSSDSSSQQEVPPSKKRKVSEPSSQNSLKKTGSSSSSYAASSSSESSSSSEDEEPVKKTKVEQKSAVKKERDSSSSSSSISSSSDEEKIPHKKKPEEKKVFKMKETPGIKRLASPSKNSSGKVKKSENAVKTPSHREKIFLNPPHPPKIASINSGSPKTPTKTSSNDSAKILQSPSVQSPSKKSPKKKNSMDSPVKSPSKVKLDLDDQVKKSNQKVKPASDYSSSGGSSDSDSD